ncbi:lipocalin family protein [Spirosoma utsteinense]|uniref:Lipocalin-like domain-containing protein n=1 Tax=Spirosoma utsteinense TaxID=2585773 RepID=A0ABR6W8P0_9BACT|nr:lipocalin family protein [Spirosoma utsteinense]MBC3788982.1 hypothetical protein [Spirosoma utsteinense]MBC3792523.1 hypothetical protein [Spirosoma utsteinense]
MKNLISERPMAWMLVMAMPLWFGSCKKDAGETVTPTATSIEGNYKVSALKVNPKVQGFEDLLPVYSLLIGTTCLSDITVSFKSGGVVSTDSPASCQSNSDDIANATGIDSNSKWVSSGTKLTITDSDQTTTTYDVSFSGANMQLAWQEDDIDATGKPFKQGYTMELKRL